jgi:hypothetical protein
MTPDWNDLEGVSLAGKYWLKQCLYSTADEAAYLTRFGAACDATVRLIRADAPHALERLEAWREALGMEHPHLLRMLDTGRTTVADAELIYAVCEYPDELLSRVLLDRPLSSDEARAVLDACIQALRFVHDKRLVLGGVDAARIGAVGDTVKLPCDSIARANSHGEVGAEGTAADMWALGILLAEMLTQQRPTTRAEAGYLPEPFATIVSRTLRNDPAERWPVAEVESYLRKPAEVAPPPQPQVEVAPAPPAAMAVPVEPDVSPAPVTPDAEPTVRVGHSMKWVPLAGLVAAAGLSALFLTHGKEPAAKPAVHSAPAPAAPPVMPPAVRPSHPAVVHDAVSSLSRESVWRVVVYEYSQRSAAEHKARTLNQKHPAWHAEVFAPRGEHAPYFVALGGRMTRPEAERLKLQARSAGLPRDTFVRNFAN